MSAFGVWITSADPLPGQSSLHLENVHARGRLLKYVSNWGSSDLGTFCISGHHSCITVMGENTCHSDIRISKSHDKLSMFPPTKPGIRTQLSYSLFIHLARMGITELKF